MPSAPRPRTSTRDPEDLVVYAGFEPAAVLDWEMAALAPCEVDLGWTICLHRFFQDLTVAFGQRGLPGFLRRDRVEARYAELTGHTPRDMEFHTLYAALRHAIVMLRVAYRQVRFGEAVVPADPDTLILHHGSLRAMVQGSYWDRTERFLPPLCAQAAARRIPGTRIGREPGPPTCEKGCVRQSSP